MLAGVGRDHARLFKADRRVGQGHRQAGPRRSLCRIQVGQRRGAAVADGQLGIAQRQQQRDALRVGVGAALRQQAQCLAVELGGLFMGQRLRRVPGSPAGVGERLGGVASGTSLLEVVGQLCQALVVVGSAVKFQQFTDAAVQLDAARRGELLVQRVAHQHMHEAVAIAAGDGVEHAGGHGLVQCLLQRGLVGLDVQLQQQAQLEMAPDAGGDGQHAPGARRQARQPAGDHVAHAIGHAGQCLGCQRAGQGGRTRGSHQAGLLRQQPDRLHQVQRMAFGAGVDRLGQLGPGQTGLHHEGHGLVIAEAFQPQAAKVRHPGQLGQAVVQRFGGRAVVVAAGQQQAQRPGGRFEHQELQQAQRARVGAVHVVQHQQPRCLTRQHAPEAGHRVVQRKRLAGIVRQRLGRGPLPQPACQLGHDGGDQRQRRGVLRLQGGIGQRVQGVADQLAPGPERRRTGLLQAAAPVHHHARALGQCRGLVPQPRLADAGGTDHRHGLALAGNAAGQQLAEQPQLARAADKVSLVGLPRCLRARGRGRLCWWHGPPLAQPRGLRQARV